MTMRLVLAMLLLLVVVVLSVAGFRGGFSRRPPIELFNDMTRQPKIHPQSASDFFADGLAARPPVPGTVARDSAWADTPLNTGRVTGTTNFVELNPRPLTPELIARGRERFTIFCQPCHGPLADGRGITAPYGLVIVANLHDPRIVRLPDGELFDTITHGKNNMAAYGASIALRDRWAIIAYLRVLQLSQLGTAEDMPAARPIAPAQ
jgi:mono/diheme cytochrome c family protein